jgi:hypothetical protein
MYNMPICGRLRAFFVEVLELLLEVDQEQALQAFGGAIRASSGECRTARG